MRFTRTAAWRRMLPPLAYLALALVLTWPLALHMGDRFPGDNTVDAWGHYWNIWWLREAISHGKNPYFTDLWFAPRGTPLYLHTLAIYNSLLGQIPQVLAGTLAAYNVVVLLTIAMAGQAMYLLARRLTDHAGAAFVGGLAFAASPYLMGHLDVGHLNVAALAPLPLFLLGLLGAARGSWRYGLLAALAFLMTALSEWHTTIFAILAGGVVIGWLALLALRREESPWAPARAIGASLLGGALVLPLALQTARTAAAIGDSAELAERWGERHSANLLAFVLPQDLNPLWDQAIQHWREANLTEVITEGRVSLGIVVLLLALVGIVALRWRALPWAALVVGGVALALGPDLHVGTRDYSVTMPFDLFEALPYADLSRTPARFAALAVLALAILTAFGVRWLARRSQRPALVVGMTALLVTSEFLTTPFGLAKPPDTAVSQVIGREIAADDPAGTVLTLPYREAEQERVFHQVQHGRPIFGGFLPRAAPYTFRENTPGFAEFAEDQEPFHDIYEQQADPLAVLNYFHVRFVLFYRGEIEDAAFAERLTTALQRVLRQDGPAYISEDRALEAWRVPKARPPDSFARTGDGWFEVEEHPALGRMRWMSNDASIYLERSTPRPVTLSFTAYSYATPRRLAVRAGETTLGVFTVPTTPVELEVQAPPGQKTTELTFESLDGATAPSDIGQAEDDRPLSIALSQVQVRTDMPLARS